MLLRHVPPKLAFDLLATGRDVPAREALALGLATRVSAKAEVEDAACAYAAAAALLPPAAMGELKQMVLA